jgi:hypothetical protein
VNIFAAGACGYFSGKYIHKASGYKLGMKLLPYVLVPLFIGLAINPLSSPVGYLVQVASGNMPFAMDLLLHQLLLPTIAAFTIMIPLLQVRGR